MQSNLADQNGVDGTTLTHPYTCLGCSLAFTNPSSQRDHYATDLHRYNSKRRVAGLGPVSAELYSEKVAERVVDPSEVVTPSGRLSCATCNKTFNTAATQTTHLISRKHKEAVLKAVAAYKVTDTLPTEPIIAPSTSTVEITMDEALDEAIAGTSTAGPSSLTDTPLPATIESSGDSKLDLLVARRIVAAPPIPPTVCLFCPHSTTSPTETAIHMRSAHSFVIPEEEFLVDLEGLLRRLGEEVGTWNVCICCGKGYGGSINLDLDVEGQTPEELKKRASKGVEAVRNHMKSKSHCKLPYATESQRMDLADFYDFRPSYPGYVSRKEKKALRHAAALAAGQTVPTKDEWEDEAIDGEIDEAGMEVVYEVVSEDSDSEESDDGEIPESDITYGDSSYELVLPSGRVIGHRAHQNIFKQNLAPYLGATPFKPTAHSSPHTAYRPSAHSLALLSLVPKFKTRDRTHARPIFEQGLIPARGAGHGGNGDVIKARNKGEAKNAMKTVRNFREVKVYSDQAFIRGIKNNSQEHYRDHLLQ